MSFFPRILAAPVITNALAGDAKTLSGVAPAGASVQISTDNFSTIAATVTADGTGAWGYQFASALAGQTVSVRAYVQASLTAPGPLLWPVAGRVFVPNQSLGSANKFVRTTTHHPMFDAISGGILEVQWPNWRATTGAGANGGGAEVLHGAAATATAKVTYIDAGTKQLVIVNFTDATGGTTALSAADGANFVARATINNLAGTDILLDFAGSFPNGGFYMQGPLDTANGDVFQYGGSAIPLGTVPTATYTGDHGCYYPCVIRAVTAVDSIPDVGDSRNTALQDFANERFGNVGPVQRLVGKRLPVVNVSIPGETAQDFAITSQSTRRRALVAMTRNAKVFIPLGTNDIIFQGRSDTQCKTDIDAIASSLGKTLIYCTIDPATTGDINTPARPATETARRAFNTTVRAQPNKFDTAKSLESSTTPGAWASQTYVSNDFVHQTNVGNQYAVDNSGFDYSIIGSPAVLNLGVDPYPAGALYQSLSLADGWNGQQVAIAPASVYGPDHRVSAALITEDTTASSSHGAFKQPNLVLASATRIYTFNARRVSGSRDLMFQVQKNGGNYADGRAVIRLNNGTLNYANSSDTGVQTVGTVTITPVENYYKVSVPITYSSAMPANPYVFFKLADSTGSENFTGDGTSSVAVWGLDIR